MTLAVMHRNVGKRRLVQLASDEQLHPLVRHFVQLRLDSYGATLDHSFKPNPLCGSD